MSEHTQLEQAISRLESQRAVLGETATNAAVAALKQELSALDKTESGGERKLVTVMFADISGFTALSENMDPEAVRDLMNRCFDRLVPCIKNYGGTIDKFIGDEIMALFGAPVAHENDPERALRAALEIQSALIRFNTENKTQLGIHFGINTGLVLAGGIGSSGQQEYSVMGDAVNLAARLEDVSERGQILAGADTYRLTAPLFDFETLSPVTVKGKAEPVAVYRLIGAKAGASSTRGLERKGISSPLVGREKEFQTLEKLIEALSKGQGRVVGILGEAGLGKSRLMAELHYRAQGVQWHEGKTLSFGQSISYFPFQEIVRTYAGISEDDTELDAWKKLENKIVGLFPDTALEILPYLATLVAVEVQGEYVERVKYLDGDALGKRVFLAMRRFVERLARIQPLVLVFEDLHWMDTSSAELLEHLLPLVREVPLLVIGISRPDPNTAGARLREVCAEKYTDLYTEIRLSPLSPTESTQLVNNLLAIDDLPARVRETMTQKAEGNPFFIEEIIRSLLDLGAIVRDPSSGRWRATAQIETMHIPDTVQGVIMARIDRLDEDMKQALRMAAVIGRSFLYRILREVDAADGALDEHLAQLQQVELIREKQAIPELEYIFKHALAQEATYESILLQKRRELHGRVAESIEALFADRLDEFYSLLAYHYAKAENWEKAQEYLFKSGDQAGHMAADAEALEHYQQAMQAYSRAFGNKLDPIRYAQLERKIGTVLYRQGHIDQAMEHLHTALQYLNRSLPRTRFTKMIAILQEVIVQILHRLSPKIFVRPLQLVATPAVEEEIAIIEAIWWMVFWLNDVDLILIAFRALNYMEKHGYARGIATGMIGIGLGLTQSRSFNLAKSYIEGGISVAEYSQDPNALGVAFGGARVYHRFTGDLAQSVGFALQAAQICEKIGDLNGLSNAQDGACMASIDLGNWTMAENTLRAMIDLGHELGDQLMRSEGLGALGALLWRMGDLEQAEKCLLESLEIANQSHQYTFSVGSGGDLGRCYLRTGQLNKAEAILLETEKLYRQHKTGWGWQMSVLIGLVELYLEKRELAKAQAACREAVQAGKANRAYLVDVLRVQGNCEWLSGKKAAARKSWQKALDLSLEQKSRYYEACIRRDLGNYEQNLDELAKAETIFAELGAPLDLEKVRALISSAVER